MQHNFHKYLPYANCYYLHKRLHVEQQFNEIIMYIWTNLLIFDKNKQNLLGKYILTVKAYLVHQFITHNNTINWYSYVNHL